MLIRPKGAVRDVTVKKAPTQMRPEKAGAPHLQCKKLPDGTDGRTLPSMHDLAKLLENPKFRAAIDLVERATGSETALKHAVRMSLRRSQRDDLAVRVQARAIMLAKSKADQKRRGTL